MPAREPVRLHPVGTARGERRRLARLSPIDEASYRLVVSRLVPAIESHLGPGVVANRVLGRGAFTWTSLEPWRPARRGFHRALRKLAARGEVTLIDVRNCYESIEPKVVGSCLRELCGEGIDDVVALLRRFEDDGARGLPVGPEPSAILANAILAGVDRAISGVGVRHIRWVDDIAFATSDEAAALRTLDAAAEALGALGLALNERKTRVVSLETLRRSASAPVLSPARPSALS